MQCRLCSRCFRVCFAVVDMVVVVVRELYGEVCSCCTADGIITLCTNLLTLIITHTSSASSTSRYICPTCMTYPPLFAPQAPKSLFSQLYTATQPHLSVPPQPQTTSADGTTSTSTSTSTSNKHYQLDTLAMTLVLLTELQAPQPPEQWLRAAAACVADQREELQGYTGLETLVTCVAALRALG